MSSPPAGAAVLHSHPNHGGILDDDDRCGRYVKADTRHRQVPLPAHDDPGPRSRRVVAILYQPAWDEVAAQTRLSYREVYPRLCRLRRREPNTVIELTHNWGQAEPQ